MTPPQAKTLAERLSALAAFLPSFEQPDFTFGEWNRPATLEPGVMVMPYYAYSDIANAFVEMVYEFDWIVADLDWPSWKDTPEATELRDNPDKLAQATPEQLSTTKLKLPTNSAQGGQDRKDSFF